MEKLYWYHVWCQKHDTICTTRTAFATGAAPPPNQGIAVPRLAAHKYRSTHLRYLYCHVIVVEAPTGRRLAYSDEMSGRISLSKSVFSGVPPFVR